MKAPSTIVWILSCEEIVFNLCGKRREYRCVGDIPGYDEPGQEEKRATIFAGPITWWKLELGVERKTILNCLGRLGGTWKLR